MSSGPESEMVALSPFAREVSTAPMGKDDTWFEIVVPPGEIHCTRYTLFATSFLIRKQLRELLLQDQTHLDHAILACMMRQGFIERAI